MDNETLRNMLIDTLNENSASLDHFTSDTLDYAITLAKATIFPIIGEGSQETRTAISDGTTKIPVDEDGVIRNIRVDMVGDCGLQQYSVEQANQLTRSWRGCSANGDEPQAWVLDPDSPRSLWVVPAPAAGTEITYTVAAVNSTTVPDHLLVPIRHFALAYAYEKVYGNNGNSADHMQKGYNFMDVYVRAVKVKANG